MSSSSDAAAALAELVLSARGSDGPGLVLGTVSANNGDGSVQVRPDGSAADVGPVWILADHAGAAAPDRMAIARSASGVLVGWPLATTSSGGGSGDLVKIGEVVLGADAADITFSAIPQTFRSLKIVAALRSAVAADHGQIAMRFNGDTAGHYDGSLADALLAWSISSFDSQGFARPGQLPGATATAGNFGSAEITVPGYRNGNRKAWHSLVGAPENDAGAGAATFRLDVGSGVWKSTAAITSIALTDRVGSSLVAGSEAVLYGLN